MCEELEDVKNQKMQKEKFRCLEMDLVNKKPLYIFKIVHRERTWEQI